MGGVDLKCIYRRCSFKRVLNVRGTKHLNPSSGREVNKERTVTSIKHIHV